MTAYQAERARLAREAMAQRSQIERRIRETVRDLERLVDALASGLASVDAVRDRLLALEEKKAALKAELDAAPEPANVVALHPAAVARYLGAIERLGKSGHAATRCGSWSRR